MGRENLSPRDGDPILSPSDSQSSSSSPSSVSSSSSSLSSRSMHSNSRRSASELARTPVLSSTSASSMIHTKKTQKQQDEEDHELSQRTATRHTQSIPNTHSRAVDSYSFTFMMRVFVSVLFVATVPDSKGTWFPAALFIVLSHLFVLVYLTALLSAAVFGATPSAYSYLYSVSPQLVTFTLFTAWLHLLGVTAGYHRLWSHHSYRASVGVRIFLAVIGLCSFQGSARWWVLKHRLHHRFTDTANDPYDSTRGLWYSHCGWLFQPPPFFSKTKLIDMKDMDEDKVVVFQKRWLLTGYVLFGFLIPGLIGRYLMPDCSFTLGWIWIGMVSRFLSWHGIWTINSLSHWQGYKEYSRASSAVYIALLNLVQNGEGHHNSHHAFPQDYRHGSQTE